VALSTVVADLRMRAAYARSVAIASDIASSGYTSGASMGDPIVFRMSMSVGLVTAIQAIAPSLISIVVLYTITSLCDIPFSKPYVVLASITAALATVLLQPPRQLSCSSLASARLPMALRIVGRWFTLLAILLAIGFLTKSSDDYSRLAVMTWAVVNPPALILASLAIHELMRRVLLAPVNARAAVFVGCNPASLALADRLVKNSELCIRVEGFFDDRSLGRLPTDSPVRLLGRLEELSAYVKKQGIQVIFISLPVGHVQRVKQILDELQDTTASVYYVPEVFGPDMIQARCGELLGVPVVAMCETPFYGYRGVAKRLIDIVASAAGLLLLAPLLLGIALLVRWSSPGPILFKQRRYGLDGEPFPVYKFRTMSVTEDADRIRQATRRDARVTPLGAVLRRYSLDELPQLINVLQGRMSLVGPRPHAVAHNEMYRKLIKGYMVRHKVLPGITGLAQVSGLRGETRTVAEMEARVRCDLEYLRHWSLMLDVRILFRTAIKLLRDRNAY
jgi:putative colanic acid biosynthesis UDP-glucose lipid carrier transferase